MNTLNELLDQIKSIHEKKRADYASLENPYENFDRASLLASWFTDPVDKVFAVLLGVKLARIANLRSKQGIPNNESIEDSFLDLTTYCAIWSSYRKDKNNLIIENCMFSSDIDYRGRAISDSTSA